MTVEKNVGNGKQRIDKLFEIGLLLVTVLAASELQYASFRYSSPENLHLVNYFFRALTIPIILLVMLWLLKDLVPSLPVRFPLKRYTKEFCWTLFGNFFFFEILFFISLSFIADSSPFGTWGKAITLVSFFVTFPATWQYRKADERNPISNSVRFSLLTICEHVLIYTISYVLSLFIVIIVGVVPMPPM